MLYSHYDYKNQLILIVHRYRGVYYGYFTFYPRVNLISISLALVVMGCNPNFPCIVFCFYRLFSVFSCFFFFLFFGLFNNFPHRGKKIIPNPKVVKNLREKGGGKYRRKIKIDTLILRCRDNFFLFPSSLREYFIL